MLALWFACASEPSAVRPDVTPHRPQYVLPGPLAAAVAFGGVVALGGGVMALAMWRRG